MATTADFGRIKRDGTLEYTHISGDGYPSGAGAIILKHYQTEEALDRLFAGKHIEELGDDGQTLSHLDPEEGEPSFDYLELNYLFQDGKWFYRDWDSLDHDDTTSTPPLIPLTREDILRDARGYSANTEQALADYLDGNKDRL